MIPFNIPPYVGNELEYIKRAIDSRKICGDGFYTKKCNEWLERRFSAHKVMLTTSGTAALEMAALLCDFKTGDEVILPSFTFSSTATAFVMAGARLKFVDIRPDTMNIDEGLIEEAITEKTKAICVVHYAGVACDMNTIMEIARRYSIRVVEDAAQGVMSEYRNKALGTIGDFGCYSFHETKNYSMGEGGALVINDENLVEKAEVIREKGTNREQFFRGQVAKYNWVDYGSSYLPSDINAAYLWGQLQYADEIFKNRMKAWDKYRTGFVKIESLYGIEQPIIPSECKHNAHMYYIKCKDLQMRSKFIEYMKMNGVQCVFHYVPLHSAPAGLKYGVFFGDDCYTTKESDKLVRLPLYFGISEEETDYIIKKVTDFFDTENKGRIF